MECGTEARAASHRAATKATATTVAIMCELPLGVEGVQVAHSTHAVFTQASFLMSVPCSLEQIVVLQMGFSILKGV